jgi:intracellular multiplication protein IcmO
MPIALAKYSTPYRWLVRDVRPTSQRIAETMDQPSSIAWVAAVYCGFMGLLVSNFSGWTDVIALTGFLFFRWAFNRPFNLPFKIPKYANILDPRNPAPGTNGPGSSEGILYIGNTNDKENPDCGQEIWFTNNDARTHILYLGTTGAGKTEGLKAMVTNALAWGSGYVYVDGKADTDLWASLYSVARRFGRDDDLFVLNYMTGNSDEGALSNSMNPFSNGSSSYLANMITSFMPDAGGDNAMWKERAVALMFALMPALVYKRDKQGLLLDIGVVRDHIELQPIIRLSRDSSMPERITHALEGYLHTLPGFVDAAFDDEGNERPPSPDQPMYDLQVARQQHGYLSMQFTRSLQMLADEYGYIFKAQLADVDMLDVVLNRRILVTLIPALEKSGDEAANLGKIVAASLKGMMGATLGNTVEGSWENAIGSKQTRSASSFMTVFDEVGYYTAQGMAVMAAQARSLGFSLVFASQDLPAMEKRVKAEAKSIVGNCNIKLFGRLEDPTDTKEFLSKHSGTFWSIETSGFRARDDTLSGMLTANPYFDDRTGGSVQSRQRVDYDHVREQREGQIHMFYGDWIARGDMFYVKTEKVKALRVLRMLPVPSTTPSTAARERAMNELLSHLKDPEWTAAGASAAVASSSEITALAKGVAIARTPMEVGIMAMASVMTLPVAKGPPEATTGMKSPAAAATGANGGTTLGSRDARIVIPEISSTEKSVLRTNLPAFHEGDQYSVGEVDQAPPTQSKAPPAASGGLGGTSYVHTDADLAVITPVGTGGVDEAADVLNLKLPAEISAILEQSAKILNQGLSGKTEGR